MVQDGESLLFANVFSVRRSCWFVWTEAVWLSIQYSPQQFSGVGVDKLRYGRVRSEEPRSPSKRRSTFLLYFEGRPWTIAISWWYARTPTCDKQSGTRPKKHILAVEIESIIRDALPAGSAWHVEHNRCAARGQSSNKVKCTLVSKRFPVTLLSKIRLIGNSFYTRAPTLARSTRDLLPHGVYLGCSGEQNPYLSECLGHIWKNETHILYTHKISSSTRRWNVAEEPRYACSISIDFNVEHRVWFQRLPVKISYRKTQFEWYK